LHKFDSIFRSVPVYDESNHLVSYGAAPPDLCLKTIQNLVLKYDWSLEEAIQFSTCNPAVYLDLPLYVFGKGQILKTPT